MIYTTYDPATGQIQATFSTPDEVLPDHAVPGRYTDRDYYWDGNQMQPKPADPSGIVKYDFDWSSRTWVVNHDRSSESIRNIRNELLAAVDRINPVWYSTLTAQQQQELAVYRQDLLDLPQQAGFPAQVTWPSKPQWL